MQRLLALVAAMLLITPSLSVHAETSPAKKELVQKIVKLQQPGVEAFARAVIVEQPVGQMLQAAGRVLQQAPEADRAAIGKEIEADARRYADDVSPGVKDRVNKTAPGILAPMLEEKFSEDELKALMVWLESPVSKKYGQMQPDMQRALAERLVADSRSTIEPKLKALEASIAKRLGVAPPEAPPSGSKPPKK